MTESSGEGDDPGINDMLDRFARVLHEEAANESRQKMFVLDILPGVKRERLEVLGTTFEFPSPVYVMAEGKRLQESKNEKQKGTPLEDLLRLRIRNNEFEMLADAISSAKSHLMRAGKYVDSVPQNVNAVMKELRNARDNFQRAEEMALKRPKRVIEQSSLEEKSYPGGIIDIGGDGNHG